MCNANFKCVRNKHETSLVDRANKDKFIWCFTLRSDDGQTLNTAFSSDLDQYV